MLSMILAASGWLAAWLLAFGAVILVIFLVAFAVAKLRRRRGSREEPTNDKEDLP